MRRCQERKDTRKTLKRRESIVKIAKIYNVRCPIINDARNRNFISIFMLFHIYRNIEIWINVIINISSFYAEKKMITAMKRLLISKR